MVPPTHPQDELTTRLFQSIQTLSASSKAELLLTRALELLDNGQYGTDVEVYLELYLRTPGLTKEQVTKALLARGKARKAEGDSLIMKATQDFKQVLTLYPTNHEALQFIQPSMLRALKPIAFMSEPSHKRTPPEIWSRIASHIPRYHLRTWLWVSPFHREIALTLIFRTLDLYFGEDQQENLHRGMDVFDRVKQDPRFARRISTLRIHWAYEEGDMLDLMTRIFRSALPTFIGLREFEWIGYPELQGDMVQALLKSHPQLESIGLMGFHFDAEGVSKFSNLTKFTLRAEDDDGSADMGEIRAVLDSNERTLRHLCLGAYLERNHSWDAAFHSVTIKNLTHLDLVDTRISHVVLARIAHAHQLQSLTLHGTFDEPSSASVVFGSDHIIEGMHTFLPHLTSFRFVLVGHDNELGLFQNVVQFLRHRPKLRRLDLGCCPWGLVSGILPDLMNLEVLRVRIGDLTVLTMGLLVQSLPPTMTAIHLAAVATDRPINEFAPFFKSFRVLQMLHLNHISRRRPMASMMSDKELELQSDLWCHGARSLPISIPSLDFIGWNGEHYVVVRRHANDGKVDANDVGSIELKELPTRRKLDCSKGVDLGSDDAWWLERKDVPIDWEVPTMGSTT